MKKLILAALLYLVFISANAQEYQMVVQKTDGTETTYSYDDLISITFYDEGICIHPNSIANYLIELKFSEIAKIYFKNNASLNEANTDAVLLYPNPAASSLRIAGAEKQRVEIYSMDGKMIYNGINNGEEINVASFEKGIYAVKINGKTFKFSKL
ncbi:MAG: T9SS type A sorting domain-containing protein [Bacteroidales bacterium]|nr:T9SS type A sorting domain-containing protein [Bacteroidales bacterium]MBP3254724.1 T9SS type A sorting domain-containing protein [Bacteroidales bacterium]